MKRAVQTAEPLAERLGLAVEILDDLRESDHRSRIYVPSEEMERDDPSVAHYSTLTPTSARRSSWTDTRSSGPGSSEASIT